MKYLMKDGTVTNEITQENYRDYVEVILSRKEFLDIGKMITDTLAEHAYRATIEDL